jgi:hypothetical protein
LPGAITKEVAILPPCHLCHPFSFWFFLPELMHI